MKRPTVRELWALPELAIVPALLAVLDGMLASLHAQHGTLKEHWQPEDPPSLCEASFGCGFRDDIFHIYAIFFL